MQIRSIHDLTDLAGKKPTQKLAVAAAEDEDILVAVKMAMEKNLIAPVLVGDTNKITAIAEKIGMDLGSIEIHHATDHAGSCSLAVELVRDKKAGMLMKGMVKTGTFLRPVISKDNGLLESSLLSHFALFGSPYYSKILGITDVAINIAPDLSDKITILNHAVNVFHILGIELPRVAILSAIETVNPKIEATVHAAILSAMNRRNQIRGCIVDGPFALDNAISPEAASLKGIQGEVAGNADLLIVPDLNSGNLLYKALNFLGGATCAAIVLGASVPVVLTSRADSSSSKLLSIALASVIGS